MKKREWILFFVVLVTLIFIVSGVQAKEYTNSIGMKFVNIPAGSFYMGSCKMSGAQKKENEKRKFMGLPPKKAACPSGAGADNDAFDNETPQHLVKISKSFQLGKYEVTLGQFKKFIAGAERGDLLTDDFMQYNSHGNNAAVCHVSWNDAQAFVRWLNKKEGGNHYRLPTEAEWEYAVRAGTKTRYFWGNSAGSAGSYAWYYKNAGDVGAKYAHAVGQKKPNPWGLYDMAGNVWEWCQDWYGENYYGNSPSVNPGGPSSGRNRVNRGGGWFLNARNLRSANRDDYSPGDRYYNIGFRLMRMP